MNIHAHVAVAAAATVKTARVCLSVRTGEHKTSLDLINETDVISSHELSGLHYD